MDTCKVCGKPLTRGARGPAPVFCSSRCQKADERRRKAVDWTEGAEPVRIEHIDVPDIPLDDLAAFWLQQQREAFATARDLARRSPEGVAWRWLEWLEHEDAFAHLFPPEVE